MLKPISRLRSICKGDLNHNTNPTYSIHHNNHHSTGYTMVLNRISKRVLHSIPVLSIFVLLGIMEYVIINPSNLTNILSLGLGESDGEVYAAESTSNNTSLIIDNGTATSSTATVRNGVAYSSHTVQVKADNITGYILSITGPANLSNGGTTIGGAGGKTGTQLASADTGWGYGWNTTSTADTNMTYNSFTGSAQTLETNNSATSANFTKKLVFAAKFDQNATEGHYRANVKLNLTVTPKTLTGDYSVTYNLNGGTGNLNNMSITTNDTSYTYTIPDNIKPTKTGYRFIGYSSNNTATVHYLPGDSITLTKASSNVTLSIVWKHVATNWNGLVDMQDMTPEACASASVGAEKTLIDTRDNSASSYPIRKLADGNCWMTTNLTLDLSKAGVATLAESDFDDTVSGYPAEALPNRYDTESTNAWQDNKTIAQFSKRPYKIGSGSSYQSGSGYFYNFKAATAGTINDDAASGDATGSICPKGWHLPSRGDFEALYNKGRKSEMSSNKRILLGASSESAGGAYFLAAGMVVYNGFFYGGKIGYYWSRTVYDSGSAYNLYFDSSYIRTTEYNGKYGGESVRCVAYSS